LNIYHRDTLAPGNHYIYEEGSEYLRELKRSWDRNLKEAFNRLPQVAWSTNWDNKNQEKKNS
jgi:putative proteasome-type protease